MLVNPKSMNFPNRDKKATRFLPVSASLINLCQTSGSYLPEYFIESCFLPDSIDVYEGGTLSIVVLFHNLRHRSV